MAFEEELTAERLSEDHWLVLDHPIPQGADEKLLKAARAAAVVCHVETEDLIAHDSDNPHARDLKKIEAILTDIRHRLGEPEPQPLEPGMKSTLDELEKTWATEAQKTAAKPKDALDRLIEEQDTIARARQDPVRTERPKDHDREPGR
jgi:hypothetical protein